MSEINVSRCRSRIEKFVRQSDTEYGVPVSVSKFSAGVGEVVPLIVWAELEYDGDDKAKPENMSSIKRVAEALDVTCDGCRKGCKVLNWLPLVTIEVSPLTAPKLEYTSEPMPLAPSTDDVEETVELITA